MNLETPHIALSTPVGEALGVLQGLGHAISEETESEHCFRLKTPTFSVAIYPRETLIASVWYDDPVGRESDAGIQEKVRSYLERYGNLRDWELRMDNGWMHYWFNPRAEAAMVYGIHNDVLRFNRYTGE